MNSERFSSKTEYHDCPFCPQLINQSPFVIESGEFVSMLLSLEGHPLVVSNKHFTPLTLPEEVAADIGRWSFNRISSLLGFYKADGINVITNVGDAAGQEVEHIHTHLLPRFTAEGRKFPRMIRKNEEERIDLAQRLRDHLSKG
jgi:histidine triad (HIT) family protein